MPLHLVWVAEMTGKSLPAAGGDSGISGTLEKSPWNQELGGLTPPWWWLLLYHDADAEILAPSGNSLRKLEKSSGAESRMKKKKRT